ncbi:branched-chain amino acid transaminase [Marine Group I thaumarchaeote]|jgi:branched-chain amino acid aminotransferase|uniref:Branched-chain-amino-acid aminotransferase n=1 Tax=Marine Group I thaumarchaeote TaxID=2511932 RepID=A0A7K4NWD2_9ARCH|nr:MAG: branched-chain amino acid transaminase [Nitrosopumilus sp. YT1]NMI81859.1 branched-chain amino acid transaminase [Candidatus Nitrosopumilus sp. MTA1]NWJ19798.1 branched-chain amino acid transaminase [Marine Group I thaumarchaeote]NWJ28193.1 branched-chain amino acid transaminase [Marine Group I thaumarchaeote]NWJ56633.1 branched-chain amino acid transaminase [Marine Group I thaumarchaeote]
MKLPLSKYVWFDGKYILTEKAQVPITTHAIHYGTSIFEGIRAYWNRKNLHIFRLDEHVKRFRRSGQFYNISLNFSDKVISDAIIGICRKNKIKKSCYIRPFYFVGDYGINLYVTEKAPTNVGIFSFLFGDLFNKNGISAGVVSWRKFSDKSTPTQAKMGGNYLNSIIATQEAKRNGVDEAILLDHNGNVSEAPGENIFIVRDEQLATPSLASSALEGITRDSVIKIARDLDIDVVERDIARIELSMSDEIFLTGTAAEITPIITMDSKKVGNGKPGVITKKMMKEYTNIVMNKNDNYSHWLTTVY